MYCLQLPIWYSNFVSCCLLRNTTILLDYFISAVLVSHLSYCSWSPMLLVIQAYMSEVCMQTCAAQCQTGLLMSTQSSPHNFHLTMYVCGSFSAVKKLVTADCCSMPPYMALCHKQIHITGILLQGLNMRYKFLMTNGLPGDYWHEHFSADEFCEWVVYAVHGVHKLHVALICEKFIVSYVVFLSLNPNFISYCFLYEVGIVISYVEMLIYIVHNS
jgi:hypothetical protein